MTLQQFLYPTGETNFQSEHTIDAGVSCRCPHCGQLVVPDKYDPLRNSVPVTKPSNRSADQKKVRRKVPPKHRKFSSFTEIFRKVKRCTNSESVIWDVEEVDVNNFSLLIPHDRGSQLLQRGNVTGVSTANDPDQQQTGKQSLQWPVIHDRESFLKPGFRLGFGTRITW